MSVGGGDGPLLHTHSHKQEPFRRLISPLIIEERHSPYTPKNAVRVKGNSVTMVTHSMSIYTIEYEK